ncbi:hypothetical protein BDN72DRAFT_209785 [Pluteus cervinus]|uniref:Uncharacterized protein n=1 Tax=Pluteus cervinus TaxID=181527 RepID=A0ACD3AHQ9_9AGAR|nr:hypothetical protein BDN72DRAFT_209785 [Pluteus cervinus]
MSVTQFLEALNKIEAFPSDKFVNRLYNKARLASNVDIFQNDLSPAPAYGQDPNSMLIDGVNVTPHLQLLAEQAAVKGLSRYDPGADKHGLRNCANIGAADIAADALFTQTSTMLYSEHINWSLVANGSPDLKALRANVDFVNGLETQLHNPHFIRGAIKQDLTNGNHIYTTALLFSYDYVHYGPGFTPHLDGDFTTSWSGKLLSNWLPQVVDGLTPAQKATAILTASKAASLVHGVTSSGTIKSTVSLVNQVKSLASVNILSAAESIGIDQLAGIDTSSWKSIAATNKVAWANFDNTWANAVVAVASVTSSDTVKTSSDGDDFLEGFALGATLGLEDHQNWRTTTITGQAVANWINQGRQSFNALFTQGAPNVVNVKNFTTDGPVKSCFIAGTEVVIESGTIAIELITEGTRVLTRADPAEYGVASDEDVVVSQGAPILCGINDEALFFTPGHVFYTTTGLKAVDPTTAKEENPWLDVGRLRPGHILYRLKEDHKTYEHVEVKHIKVEKARATKVYGVHLREGQRSYHANGYLVAVNYPEITIKSIARMLSTFPKHVQTQMLSSLNELKPLFHKFGAATISDVLSKEIRGVTSRPISTPAPRPTRRHITSHLRMAKRSYALHQTGSHNVQNYQLPLLSIHEGTVSLDGQAQSRAIIDKTDRSIRWTRPVAGHGYEHGFVNVNNHGLSGHGVIILSDNANLKKLPTHKSSAHKVVRFQAVKPNVNVDKPSRNLNHANMRNLHTSIHKPTPAATPSPVHAPTVKSPPLKVPGLSLTSQAVNAGTPVSDDYIDNEDYWDLILDKTVWPVNTKQTTISQPMPMGQVAFATYHAGGSAGLSIPILSVPALDQLLIDINKSQYLAGAAPYDSLYDSMVEITSGALQMGTVYLTQASLLYALADKPTSGGTLPSLYNLTFKSIGSAVTLPLLFRTLAVQLSADFSSATGAATEYNTDNRGADGDRHLVLDSDSMSLGLASTNNRANIAKTLAVARPQPVGITTAASVAPAPVTLLLTTETDLSVDTLENIDYNSVQVHSTSGTLLQNMMLYHMNADDRTAFLQTAAPRIPAELGDNLATPLKTWIRGTYGPAFISFMIAQTKSKDVVWRNAFSQAEIDKVWYWWNGMGSSCLSKTSEYNQINALTSVAATRQLYDTDLQPFLQSPQPLGPAQWALALYNKLNDTHAKANVLRKPINGGESVLNKYCNIMLALDPTGNATGQYFDAVVAYAVAQKITNPYFPLDNDGATALAQQEWLNDSMKQLVISVLNNDPNIDGTVKSSLQQDITDFLQAEGMAQGATAEETANEIVTHFSEFTAGMVSTMSAIGTTFAVLARCNGFKAATAVVNNVMGKLTRTGGFPFMKGAMILLTVAGYIYQAYNTFTHWNELTGAQRAIGIITVLSMVADVAASSFQLYKDIKTWKADRKNIDLTPEEETKAGKLDENVEEQIQSPANIEQVNQANVAAQNETVKQTYLNNVSDHEQAIESADISESRGPSDLAPGDAIATEKEPPADLPASARSSWKAFTTSEKVLKCVNIAVGVAFTIAMSIDLKNNWDTYTDVGKVLNVLQIVIQVLSVLVDAALLLGDALLTAAAPDAVCAMMVALPVLGAILAVLGIVVTLLLAFLGVVKPRDPPKTPVETFIDTTARPLINGLTAPPPLSLTYTVPASLPAGSTAGFSITAKNNTAAAVTLTRSTLTLEVGDDDNALFSGPTTSWTVDSAFNTTQPLSQAGTVGASPPTISAAQLTENDVDTSLNSYDIAVVGPATNGTSGPLVVEVGASVSISWLGTISKVGSTTMQIVETLVSGDKCRLSLVINRV